MAIPGPLVHQQLMDAYSSLQADFTNRRDHVIRSRSEWQKLDTRRAEALVALAEHYLPELNRQAVEGLAEQFRTSIVDILMRQQDRAETVHANLQAATQQRQQYELEFVKLDEALEQAREEMESVASRVEQILQEDASFIELSQRGARAEAALERAEENLVEIDQDAVRKLPAYEECRLFQYLYRRGYGTPAYKWRGLTRRMDRWLARYLDYSQKRKSYDFLRRTPDNMRRVIAEDRETLDLVMNELERRRDEVAQQCGLQEVTQRLASLEQQRSELLVRLDKTLVEAERLHTEMDEIQDPRGPFYQEAIDRFRGTLQAMDLRDLKRKAQATEEITDDQIVARLAGIESDRQQLDHEAGEHHRQTTQLRSFLEDLGRLIQRFRAAGFDSARSQFVDSLNIQEEIELARQRADINQLWQRVRRAQRWGADTGEHAGGFASHPLTQVLVGAMAHAAGGALADHARKASRRRYSSGRKSWESWVEGFGSWGDSSGDYRDRRKGRS